MDYREDILSTLYAKALDEDTQLRNLAKGIKDCDELANDSLKNYLRFKDLSERYFTLAKINADMIKDSVLKKEMKSMLKTALDKYNTQYAAHEALLKSINSHKANISDYENALKLTVTLNMMQQYQKSSLDRFPQLQMVDKRAGQLEKQVVQAARKRIIKVK